MNTSTGALLTSRLRNNARHIAELPNMALDKLEARLFTGDDRVLLNSLEANRAVLYGIVAVLCYISVVGATTVSEVRHTVPGLFGIFLMLLPAAVGLFVFVLYILITHAAYNAGTRVFPIRQLVVIAIACMMWSIGDLLLPIAAPHITLLLHDAAIVMLILGYAGLPSPQVCAKMALSMRSDKHQPPSVEVVTSELPTTATAEPITPSTAGQWRHLVPMDTTDNTTIRIVYGVYVILSAFTVFIVPLVIPRIGSELALCMAHGAIALTATIIAVRMRYNVAALIVVMAGLVAHGVMVMSVLLATHGITIFEVLGWVANYQAFTLLVGPAVYIAFVLAYDHKMSWKSVV
jgi:hypothetical protein